VEIDAVVFDVGETLVDETREYGTWAPRRAATWLQTGAGMMAATGTSGGDDGKHSRN